MDISVIIPTRNRAQSLQATLQQLAAQQTGGAFTYEVLVVDNGSTDATAEAVRALSTTFPVPLRYLAEPRVGKPWALNTGMATAQGQFFAFTDDDILPEPTWLQAIWRCFIDEGADGVAGRIVPRWTGPRPAWIEDEACRGIGTIGCVDHGPDRRRSRRGQDCRWVGGNFAVRRDVPKRVGLHDVRLLRGQDTDYYRRCLACGLQICYEPTALAYHQVNPERVSIARLRQWYHRTGYYQAYTIPWKWHHALTVMPLWWYAPTGGLLIRWAGKMVGRQRWVEAFKDELRIRCALSLWTHRLRMLPRWWLSLLTGRSYLP